MVRILRLALRSITVLPVVGRELSMCASRRMDSLSEKEGEMSGSSSKEPVKAEVVETEATRKG